MKRIVRFLLAMLLPLSTHAEQRPAEPLLIADRITADQVLRIRQILSTDTEAGDPRPLEREYQQIIQRQMFSDVLKIYSPEFYDRVQVTYASFTESGSNRPLTDGGFGFHIVKRLVIPGKHPRTVEVAEAWPEDGTTGALHWPNEIRMKTQVFNGPRRERGSQNLYLYDSVRLLWEYSSETPSLYRRTIHAGYDTVARRNRYYEMQSPVGSPHSCVQCHGGGLVQRRAQRFLAPGEAQNFESFVQDSHFRRPLNETNGYREYMNYLIAKHVPDNFRQTVARALQQRQTALHVQGFREALEALLRQPSFTWYEGDDHHLGTYGSIVNEPNTVSIDTVNQLGVYRNFIGEVFADIVEMNVDGRYRWWTPTPAIP